MKESKETSPKLEVLVSTLGEAGLERLSCHRLPAVDGVAYVVSCQATEPYPALPSALVRDDLRVAFTSTRGISVNRNHLLDIAAGPYVLVADDDLDFDPDGLRAVIRAFDSDQTLDMATFRHKGCKEKIYPADGQDLRRKCRGYYITAFEIALRLDSVRARGLRFCEEISIGTRFATQGEEDLFFIDALRSGMHGRFFDAIVATHTGPTSGLREFGPGAMHARGLILAKRYRLTAFPRAVLTAWRLRRRAPFFAALVQITAGILYAPRIGRRQRFMR